MSEHLVHDEERIKILMNISMTIVKGDDPSHLIKQYKDIIETVTPYEIIEVENRQMQKGVSVDNIKKTIGKVVNVLFKGLSNYKWKKPEKDTFLYLLMEENSSMNNVLNKIKKELIKTNREKVEMLTQNHGFVSFLKQQIGLLQKFNSHHIKKENILFPYLEKKWNNYAPLQVMWSIDDDIRNSLKEISALLEMGEIEFKQLNILLGRLFFLLLGMKIKEELVVFPRATETLTQDEFLEMGEQAKEIGFFFPDNPARRVDVKTNKLSGNNNFSGGGNTVNLETGFLTEKELKVMLNTLPVDITFVDATDKVKYFSSPKDRIFPRSKAIIGREVQNCHPPESVHIVEEIVNRFKSGKKSVESFWIEMNGKFVLIQYFALRDENGEYLGTLEVSTDATFVRSLKGEKRLLDV
jgi:DUF438 domain-containing protein